METLQFQFPVWYLILCAALGLAVSGVLYFRDKTFVDKPTALRLTMAILRFVAVTLVAALLLSPFVRLFEESRQEPIVVIATDNSRSVGEYLSDNDSTAFIESLNRLEATLGRDYQVDKFVFGDQVRDTAATFTDNSTDIEAVISQIAEQYDGQNLGAVIMATDGIYNKGTNPVYTNAKLGAPLFTIALGDTSVKTDISVQKVLHNRISFLGDRFPVQVDISANRLEGRDATLSIQKISGGQATTLIEEKVSITRENFFETREFILNADVAGVNRYRARLSGVGGEENYANNSKDFYIEVIDGRLEILILASSAHPDIGALRDAISSNENYNVSVDLIEDFTDNVSNYDLVILHQIPDMRNPAEGLFASLNASETPRIFILGSQSSIPLFNQEQDLITLLSNGQSPNEVTPIINQQFQLFEYDENYEQELARFVPLNAPFGEYDMGPATEVYMYQRIGSVDTQFPLFAYGKTGNAKTAVITGDGLWRWRLFDFLQNENHELTNELINKTIQYVTVKDDRRRFRASPSKNLFSTDEDISFGAELYNQTYQLVNDPEAFLVVRDNSGNEYSYTYSRTENSYAIDIGRFAEGEYTFTAFTDYEGQRQQMSGKFNVQRIMLESYITRADHSLLYALTDKFGGAVHYPNDLDALESSIGSAELKPVIYQSGRNSPLLNLKWLFGILLLILSVEWFLRRYHGAY